MAVTVTAIDYRRYEPVVRSRHESLRSCPCNIVEALALITGLITVSDAIQSFKRHLCCFAALPTIELRREPPIAETVLSRVGAHHA